MMRLIVLPDASAIVRLGLSNRVNKCKIVGQMKRKWQERSAKTGGYATKKHQQSTSQEMQPARDDDL